MSKDRDEFRPICGGSLYLAYTITFREARPHSIQVSDGVDKICYGHPVPSQKHDGYLDEDGIEHVSLWMEESAFRAHFVTLRQIHTGTHIHMKPTQALSLLSWLRQEEMHLLELSKEEEQR